MNWGKFIKEKRKQKELSIADLSQISGVKDATIYTIEKGQKSGGSIENIRKIIVALGCKLVIIDGQEIIEDVK